MVIKASATDVRPAVDAILKLAMDSRASDVHFEPEHEGYDVRFRVDGILSSARRMDREAGRAAVSRLMVMARLLTYRLDVPQEGRLQVGEGDAAAEVRVSVMPTVHGLRCVLRLPADLIAPASLEQLGLPERALNGVLRFAQGESGMLIVTGPAGSGKTTTIYALLAYIAQAQPGSSIISLEDPVERHIPGVTQIEVSPFGSLTYETALRSILRQDPQVLALGEIRDAATATLAMQAALSGHRLVTTFHAGSAGGALARLLEMGIEPYQVASSISMILNQRLLRRTKDDGYSGRVPVAEMVEMSEPLRQAVLQRVGSTAMEKIYREEPGAKTLAEAGRALVARGVTDEAELSRVLGNSRK